VNSVLVRPVIVKKASDFGQTENVDNCVMFEHENLNVLALKGPGAGKLPTANAVLADLVRLKGKQIGYRPSFEVLTEKSVYATKTYYVRTDDEIKEVLDSKYSGNQYFDGFTLVKTSDPAGLRQTVDGVNPKLFIAEWMV
jgi:hypothetical protein